MFFKLAVKNVRRSIRDYMVYFITLMLAVCIFYMFNSIDAQLVMLDLKTERSAAAASVSTIMSFLSLIIAVILAFLVIYANGFMMRRRKRELGIYMTLGVPTRKMALMLAGETILIGLLALAAGLGCGYFASQGMSVLTAKLFEVEITNYHFIFSQDALLKTCMNFAVIFLLVTLFNMRSVSKYSLAQLLAAGRENQKVPSRKRGSAVFLTALGVAVILGSYWFVLGFGFGAFMNTFLPGVAINFVGTLLLMYGLAGLFLSGREHRASYYMGLRMFSERQLASRVNTNAVSMAFICSMLFLMLVIVSSTSSMNSILNRETSGAAPFDVSFTVYTEGGAPEVPAADAVEQVGISPDMFAESFEYPYYDAGVKQGEVLDSQALEIAYGRDMGSSIANAVLDAISIRDYNRLLQMQGEAPISLGPGQYALNTTLNAAAEGLSRVSLSMQPIQVAGAQLTYSGQPIRNIGLWTSATSSDAFMLVLPDEVTARMTPYLDVLVANFRGDPSVSTELLRNRESAIRAYGTAPDGTQSTTLRMALKSDVKLSNQAINASMVFTGLYVGMVFLVAGAAVLALQTLSGASDDRPRYRLLRELGAEQKMIDKAMFSQVAVYFFLPLAIAAVHSVVGIYFMSTGMGMVGYGDILTGALTIALLICAVYGVYFAATYLSCRLMIRDKDERRTA